MFIFYVIRYSADCIFMPDYILTKYNHIFNFSRVNILTVKHTHTKIISDVIYNIFLKIQVFFKKISPFVWHFYVKIGLLTCSCPTPTLGISCLFACLPSSHHDLKSSFLCLNYLFYFFFRFIFVFYSKNVHFYPFPTKISLFGFPFSLSYFFFLVLFLSMVMMMQVNFASSSSALNCVKAVLKMETNKKRAKESEIRTSSMFVLCFILLLYLNI